MRKWLPRTLHTQLILLILLAVALSQAVSLLVYRVERMRMMRNVMQEECLGRAVSAYRLAQAMTPEKRATTVGTVETPLTRYWISREGPEPEGGDEAHRAAAVQEWIRHAREQLARSVPGASRTHLTESLFANESPLSRSPAAEWQLLPGSNWLPQQAVYVLRLPEWNGFGFAMDLGDGQWLHTIYAKPDYLMRTALTPGYYTTLFLTILIFLVAAIFIARRLSRPLRQLTGAAERLGRGDQVQPLVPEGPADIRATMEAFNRMQTRLHRFMEDRTRMLAAIGHDLRTPITSLRLRAEFVEDAEVREKIIATLDEMQAMTEAALAFARSEAIADPTRVVDLNALLQSLCDDLADLGWKVAYHGDARLPCLCRPDAVRRAVRNVIENAVRYGHGAAVNLELDGSHRETEAGRGPRSAPEEAASGGVNILVRDQGPGIPESEHERVFAPFVRAETSRNTSTGGVGLGLAITRSIIRGHGGDVTLRNLSGGMEVCLHLPLEPPEAEREAV
ncbi:MAG TPA: ATP-binding protein [Chthoniobacteraceae bacterium]|nr:ATP-binding protein [Chthoniobacteraceae bacterium]